MISLHIDGPDSSLVGQQRGGVLVMALFMLLVLSGALFLVAGNGEAIEHRNNGQGAADAAAYSAAVVHATAMNDLALLNMIKLGANATLLHLDSARAGALAGAIEAGAACGFLNISACRSAVKLTRLRRQLQKRWKRSAPKLRKMIDVADRAQELLMSAAPLYGMVRMERVARSYRGVHGALPTVFSTSLPVEYEDQGDWCWRLITRYVIPMYVATFGQNPTEFHLLAAGEAALFAAARCDSVPPVRLTADAALGSEIYQVQAFAMQGSLSNAADNNIVRATQGGRTVDGGEIDRRRQLLSRLRFAQAEYYFDGGGSLDKMLWSMRWKARLSRFQFMGGEDTFEKLCELRWPGSPCAEFKAAISDVAPLSLH